jgi:hypothetical protein
MKFIGSLQGFAAMRVRLEEYLPQKGIIHNDLIELIRSRYEFQIFPQLTPGMRQLQIFTFAMGKFPTGDEQFAIGQLAMKEDGDIVLTITTEQAALVLADLVELLDENLGYRLAEANKIFSYVSNLVVEFDLDIMTSGAEKFSGISDAINTFRTGMPVSTIKRLVFGHGPIAETNDPLIAVESADFLIERRTGSPYEANRFFSSAPLQTIEHLELLERIEQIVKNHAD